MWLHQPFVHLEEGAIVQSVSHWFKNSMEFIGIEDINKVPIRVRGIYVLYKQGRTRFEMDVVYVGMARGEKSGCRGRLSQHAKDKEKEGHWTHFSVFEAWDNISNSQIEELEGLFRHLYRYDRQANALNKQRRHLPYSKIRRKSTEDWLHRG